MIRGFVLLCSLAHAPDLVRCLTVYSLFVCGVVCDADAGAAVRLHELLDIHLHLLQRHPVSVFRFHPRVIYRFFNFVELGSLISAIQRSILLLLLNCVSVYCLGGSTDSDTLWQIIGTLYTTYPLCVNSSHSSLAYANSLLTSVILTHRNHYALVAVSSRTE